MDATWEFAQAAWLNCHLHDDDVAERLGLPTVQQRANQVRVMADAYGLARKDRVGLVDRMVGLAVHSARQDAVDYRVDQDTVSATGEDGFPILWGITWRVRSASWMLRNRTLLERALLR